MTHAACGTMENATRKCPRANTGTSVESAENRIAKLTAHEQRAEALKQRGKRPRFARQLLWDSNEEEIGPTALYSLMAAPLPFH